MDTLPDLLSLSDAELSSLLAQIEEGEEAISQRRRVLHGRIDILRAERTERLRAQVASGSFETTTMRAIRSAAITPTKMSKSRIISATVDSIVASNSSSPYVGTLSLRSKRLPRQNAQR